jgi:hypothetical protein
MRTQHATYTPVGQPPMTGSHPAGTAATPIVMPLARVLIYPPVNTGYVSLGYDELEPVWTTDGAAIPATSPGRWGQLVSAGRPLQ